MAERHILLFSRPGLWGACFPAGLSKRGASTIPAALTKGAVRRPFINTPPQSQIPGNTHPPLTLDNSGSWRLY